MSSFKQFEFRIQPWFDQASFVGWNHVIPKKTLAIYCFDPRASEIPHAVARRLGSEVYPGENILDGDGNRIGHTRTIFGLSNGGGRAESALAFIAAMNVLFHVQNIVIIRHSFCSVTSISPGADHQALPDQHHTDLAGEFDHHSLAFMDFEESIKYNLELLRASPAVPRKVNSMAFSTTSIPAT